MNPAPVSIKVSRARLVFRRFPVGRWKRNSPEVGGGAREFHGDEIATRALGGPANDAASLHFLGGGILHLQHRFRENGPGRQDRRSVVINRDGERFDRDFVGKPQRHWIADHHALAAPAVFTGYNAGFSTALGFDHKELRRATVRVPRSPEEGLLIPFPAHSHRAVPRSSKR